MSLSDGSLPESLRVSVDEPFTTLSSKNQYVVRNNRPRNYRSENNVKGHEGLSNIVFDRTVGQKWVTPLPQRLPNVSVTYHLCLRVEAPDFGIREIKTDGE